MRSKIPFINKLADHRHSGIADFSLTALLAQPLSSRYLYHTAHPLWHSSWNISRSPLAGLARIEEAGGQREQPAQAAQPTSIIARGFEHIPY
jgi:hypothetical protein